MKMFKSTYTKMTVLAGAMLSSTMLFAQAEEAAEPITQPGFFDVVLGGELIDKVIWLMILGVSIATVAFIVQGVVNIKRDKMLPEHLIEGIRESLANGDLGEAIATCEANPGALSNILTAGFNNISEGFEVINDAISAAADIETEKVMQQVNYLNICGQIAPMLGLMGTVTGMVSAFAGLAGATGASKASMLAQSISGALYTTCAGLLLAVPALIGYTLIKNNAVRIILETEGVVIDLVKVLRSAEVDED